MKNGFKTTVDKDRKVFVLEIHDGRKYDLPLVDESLKAELTEELNGLVKSECPTCHGRMSVSLGKESRLYCADCTRERAYRIRLKKLSVEELQGLRQRHRKNLETIDVVLGNK